MLTNYLIVGVIKGIVALLVSLAIGYAVKSLQKKFGRNTPENSMKTYPQIFKEESGYKYFSTGHPYVWVEADFARFMEIFNKEIYARSNTGQKMYSVFSLKVDENEKSVYIAPLSNNFDFSSLKKYQEWLDSEKEVAERIRKYKAGESV